MCYCIDNLHNHESKALYRGGVAAMHQDKFEEARLALGRLLELDPENKAGLSQRRELQRREALYTAKEAKMMKAMGANMFGGDLARASVSNSASQSSDKEPLGTLPTPLASTQDEGILLDSTGKKSISSKLGHNGENNGDFEVISEGKISQFPFGLLSRFNLSPPVLILSFFVLFAAAVAAHLLRA